VEFIFLITAVVEKRLSEYLSSNDLRLLRIAYTYEVWLRIRDSAFYH